MVIPCYPAFNIYSHIAAKTTALGPVSVATCARERAGWDVEVIDENNLTMYGPRDEHEGADHEFLQDSRPADVVGLYGGLTSTIPRLYHIARFYRERGVTTIGGGQHFVGENIREALSSGVDYVVIGEGEETIRELLDALDGNRPVSSVNGIAYREDGKIIETPAREPITDFGRIPIPDFSLVRYARIGLYPVERIRGCGMNCEFCTVKGKPRQASPERLLEQISILLETRNARHFFIVDDLFGQQREETMRFCKMLRDYQNAVDTRLDVTVQIRLDKAGDEELLSVMRRAGINTVAIGFESPIAEELKTMQKSVNHREMLSFARTFHRHGFLVHGMFIFGYPLKGGTSLHMPVRERIRRYRNFIRKARIDTIQMLLPVPLPGTALRRRLEEQNRIFPVEEVGWEYYDGNFPLFEPDDPMTADEMQRAIRGIMAKFYRFRYAFFIGWNALSFPALVFFLYDIREGWKKWYRSWRNSLVRFAGWLIMRKWIGEFKKGDFPGKLQRAQKQLRSR